MRGALLLQGCCQQQLRVPSVCSVSDITAHYGPHWYRLPLALRVGSSTESDCQVTITTLLFLRADCDCLLTAVWIMSMSECERKVIPGL